MAFRFLDLAEYGLACQGLENTIWRFEYDVNDNVVYQGWARAGTASSAEGWRIVYYTYDGNNNVLTKTFAKGNSNLVHVWDDRATYNYK